MLILILNRIEKRIVTTRTYKLSGFFFIIIIIICIFSNFFSFFFIYTQRKTLKNNTKIHRWIVSYVFTFVVRLENFHPHKHSKYLGLLVYYKMSVRKRMLRWSQYNFMTVRTKFGFTLWRLTGTRVNYVSFCTCRDLSNRTIQCVPFLTWSHRFRSFWFNSPVDSIKRLSFDGSAFIRTLKMKLK